MNGNSEIQTLEVCRPVSAGKSRVCYEVLKRVFDVLAAAGSLVVLSPVFLIIALIIYADDPSGSAIFAQNRVGQNGRTFKLYKFRTMVVDAEKQLESIRGLNEADGPVFKIRDDPRITRVGRFLRQTSLDELPQLWNVLKGDMSFVGPRPPLPREAEVYTDYQWQRLRVKPGLTCLWQTQEKRNDIPFAEWVELDLQYICDRSLWLDFKLILKTFLVMLRRDGQ